MIYYTLLLTNKNPLIEKALQRHIREKIFKAEADFTREITGVAIGGVPPFGHKNLI